MEVLTVFISVGGFNGQLEQNFLPPVSSHSEKMADFGSFFLTTSENRGLRIFGGGWNFLDCLDSFILKLLTYMYLVDVVYSVCRDK